MTVANLAIALVFTAIVFVAVLVVFGISWLLNELLP